MTPERWARVQAIFEGAVGRPLDERQSFVAREAGGDEELAALVQSLVEADTSSTTDLRSSVGRAIDDVAAAARGPREQTLGPYRIVSEIGAGGMGTVYLAERADGAFAQRVAIKVVRGLLDETRVRRFRAERQILASLDHPNIARLLDGGATDDGWPYLVMEYVEGTPIDAYCRSKSLDIPARLRLFATVCDVVLHAHRHLIVHRDIKPSNILVTGDGTPKLLDFGIAKLLDSADPELSAVTMTGMRMLTPDYAAPEQVRGEPVTTATDVYALGVLLYELLTSRRPHQFKTLTAQEIERVVCETDAPRPSTQAAGLDEDLDIITGTALQKDASRRYQSVEALVDDVRRTLDGLPIQARPATWTYRARRFAARHRWSVAAAATFLLMLVGFAVVVSVQAARIARERDLAQQERDAAEEVSSFLVGLFEVADPSESRGDTVTARELLERGAQHIETSLEAQPAVQGRLMSTIGRVYRGLGLYDRSQALLERALPLRERDSARQSDAVADTLSELGEVSREKGQYQDAERYHREALAIRRALHGEEDDRVAFSRSDLGQALQQQAKYEESEALQRQAIATWRRTRGDRDPQVAIGLNNLGLLLRRQTRFTDAEPVLREALDIRRAAHKERHPLLAASLMQFGQLYNDLGRYDEAEPFMRESLTMRLEIFGPDHPLVGVSYNNIASLLHDKRDYTRAEEMYRAAMEINRKRLGNDHPETAVTMNNLAALFEDKGDLAAAEPMYRDALAIRQKALGGEHPAVARGMNNLALLLIKREKTAEAETLAARALVIKRKTLGDEHLEVATGLTLLARLLQMRDELPEALRMLDESAAIARNVLPPDHPTMANVLTAQGRAFIQAGRRADAIVVLEEARRIRALRMQAGDPVMAQVDELLAQARK